MDDERVTSNESAGMMDVEKSGPLNCEDSPKNNGSDHETNQKEDGMKEPASTDGEKETIELDHCGKESSEKKDTVKTGIKEPPSTDVEKLTIELNNGGKESSEKEDAVKDGMKEPPITDSEKETVEYNNGAKESFEKDNTIKDDSLSQDNNGACHPHDIAIECTEKEDKTDTCSKDTCNNETYCIKACVQEADVAKTGMKEPTCTDGEKETIEPNNDGKESSEKEDAVKDGMKEPPCTDSEKETIEFNNSGKESSEKEDKTNTCLLTGFRFPGVHDLVKISLLRHNRQQEK